MKTTYPMNSNFELFFKEKKTDSELAELGEMKIGAVKFSKTFEEYTNCDYNIFYDVIQYNYYIFRLEYFTRVINFNKFIKYLIDNKIIPTYLIHPKSNLYKFWIRKSILLFSETEILTDNLKVYLYFLDYRMNIGHPITYNNILIHIPVIDILQKII